MLNTEIELVKAIEKYYKIREDQKVSDDPVMMMLANEIMSTNIYDSMYKLIPLISHAYKDSHYKIGNKYYDVFKFLDEDIDYSNLYQIVLCDNYVDICKFPQNDFYSRVYVSRFSLKDQHIYSFYDKDMIVVETKRHEQSMVKYEEIEV